jgi:hypothetical protein
VGKRGEYDFDYGMDDEMDDEMGDTVHFDTYTGTIVGSFAGGAGTTDTRSESEESVVDPGASRLSPVGGRRRSDSTRSVGIADTERANARMFRTGSFNGHRTDSELCVLFRESLRLGDCALGRARVVFRLSECRCELWISPLLFRSRPLITRGAAHRAAVMISEINSRPRFYRSHVCRRLGLAPYGLPHARVY